MLMNARPSNATEDPGLAAVIAELHRRNAASLPISNKLELGELLGLTKQAVSRWTRVPLHHVMIIEEAIGVPRHVQRPDIFATTKQSRGARGRHRSR